MKKFKTGAAYHGNRMPSKVAADMHEMSMAEMDVVVHMFSHMDMERHSKAMAEIFKASEAERDSRTRNPSSARRRRR